MGLYELPIYMSLQYFGIGIMFANVHMCRILCIRSVYGPVCVLCL